MKEIKIIAKNKTGKEAIQQHLTESVKAKGSIKTMWKALGFNQYLDNKEPYTLIIEIKNKRIGHLVRPEHISQEIIKTLEDNGASKEDFTIQID